MLNESRALDVLAALAQGTRLRIVQVLLSAFPEGMPAGRIAERLDCQPSTLTFHLRHLQAAGLVRSHRRSTSIIYSAAPDLLVQLARYLVRERCGDRPELCRPPATPPAVPAGPEPAAAESSAGTQPRPGSGPCGRPALDP